ncbi:hypothetical protein QBC38DRAFT_224649 [Podospora fimiseda]|uniref:Uncharacterized protein n=1 Tax=Podospora fimiseda TaxID=252190 RepID=A0AAN7H810_9PEZI|nr:hypothetical protein QBC38DRAFT_224649 [Podospora fimiseda]
MVAVIFLWFGCCRAFGYSKKGREVIGFSFFTLRDKLVEVKFSLGLARLEAEKKGIPIILLEVLERKGCGRVCVCGMEIMPGRKILDNCLSRKTLAHSLFFLLFFNFPFFLYLFFVLC